MITTAQNSIADLRPIHCSRVVGEVLNELTTTPLLNLHDAIGEVDSLAHNHIEFNC